jgi:hypothetical protein
MSSSSILAEELSMYPFLDNCLVNHFAQEFKRKNKKGMSLFFVLCQISINYCLDLSSNPVLFVVSALLVSVPNVLPLPLLKPPSKSTLYLRASTSTSLTRARFEELCQDQPHQHCPHFNQPPSNSTRQNSDGSSSNSRGSRCDTSRAAGVFFFVFFITILLH